MAKVMRVLCPENYDALYDDGITSKQMLRERLHQLAVVQPLQAKADVTQGMAWPEDLRGGSRLLNLSSLDIVVAGAPAGKFSSFLPAGMFSVGVAKKVGAAPRASLPYQAQMVFVNAQEVLDPRGNVEVRSLALVPRGPIAENSTIGLVDINKPGGSFFLDRMEELIKQAHPTVSVKRYAKPGPGAPVAASLLAKIKDECKYVITGLAD